MMEELLNVITPLNQEHIEKAFRKLKASAYFDKTQVIMRERLVKYEGEQYPDLKKIKRRFHDIAKLLNHTSDEKWEEYQKCILKTISCLIYPKKIDDAQTEIISNNSPKVTHVSDMQFFFDGDVEVQLLGVLWCLTIGMVLDKQVYEHAKGNRLVQNKYTDDYSMEWTKSPHLFKPYYEQYESWRDTGLQHAETSMKNHQDVLILMLDLTKYFYNIRIIEEDFLHYYSLFEEKAGSSVSVQRLNKFVYMVLQEYRIKVPYILIPNGEKTDDGKQKMTSADISWNMLPIGFYPSNIISNIFMEKFDTEISTRLNPLYYARYVDDIMIVEKLESNSKLKEILDNTDLSQKAKKEELIAYLMCSCKVNGQVCENGNAILLKDDETNQSSENHEVTYAINGKFFIEKETRITVSNEKIKVFFFESSQTDSLIECFRKEINANKSEFRYLPDDEGYLLKNDYYGIYNMKSNDTINKLRGIDSVRIDKYKLSKYLGKNFRLGNIITDKSESRFEKDMLKIFDNHEIISNFFLLEKVIETLVINKRLNRLYLFIDRIINAISTLESSKVIPEGKREYLQVGLKSALCNVLISYLNRSFSLLWGEDVHSLLARIQKRLFESHLFSDESLHLPDFLITKNRLYYIRTRMLDLSALLFLPRSDMEYDDKHSINFANPHELMSKEVDFDLPIRLIRDKATNKKFEDEKSIYPFYPYTVSIPDLIMARFLHCIKTEQNMDSTDNLIQQIQGIYRSINPVPHSQFGNNTNERQTYSGQWEHDILVKDITEGVECEKNLALEGESLKQISHFAVKIGGIGKKRLRVGIASIEVYESYFTKLMNGTPDRSYDRYQKLASVLNDAIRHKVEMLVMPEMFCPIEWIPLLTKISQKQQMAIITGIEHILQKDNVYNVTATILPYQSAEYKQSALFLHSKVHFSPEEKHVLLGYHLKPQEGTNYDIFCWNNLWFSTYCCFELASIHDRGRYQSILDLLIAVEYNKDTNYYSNIIESVSRDLHCYCMQVNSSHYGDSRLIQPTTTESKDIIKTKGGINPFLIVGEIDIQELRDFQIKDYSLQKESKKYKPTPPDFNYRVVKLKRENRLWDELCKKKRLSFDY